MALGFDGKLYILAFDHRGSFQKKMFGIEGNPTPEEIETIADAKQLIFEGVLAAVGRGAEPGATGVLVDEEFGSDIPARSREYGFVLAMPVEKSGQNEFDFDYGDDFGAHIEPFEPAVSKVLVRYEAAAPIDGFIGSAFGRSIWWDALKAFLAGELERDAAASEIAENYLHFVKIYEGQKVH